ncbi:MAG: recombinase family protein [Oscillospiraceae bacterium]|nr:recombinase family protein [Oscillospiraceae bacterium]
MATKKNKGQEEKITALYARLSDDDPENEKKGVGSDKESNSIQNQRMILYDYARTHGYLHPQFFYDDGVSGTTFERPGFKEMEELIEAGKVSTVIVKDLSRFGRNYLEVGNYLEVVYPTLGVKFIAIQENVDTLSGTGTEMMPFHNIFNEWYASQTSKKVRAVWAMKAANGLRTNFNVPFGYIRDPENQEKWLIDEPAAEVVRKIFALCLAGKDPDQIARQLEREKVLTPSAYYHAMGAKKANHPMPKNPYGWKDSSVCGILANRSYTGCTVKLKTTTISYKVHKMVYKPEDEWVVTPNTQEAIIDEDTWLRVQELRENKRRPTATGRTSLFSGLVYCPDCGSKLYFCAAKSLRKDQEFFRCANYKSGRGECTIHFIRDVVLQKIVLEAVGELADFVRCYEPVFLYLIARNSAKGRKQEMKDLNLEIEAGRRRIKELDRLISRIYEDNILGRLSDERYERMSAGYEKEQHDLVSSAAENERRLREMEKERTDLHALLKGLREFTEVHELTPELVNTLIRRIEIHNSDRSTGHVRVKVDIFFTAVGMIDLPTEEGLKALMEEMQNAPMQAKATA